MFWDLRVRDIMTPEPKCLLPDQTMSAAAILMRNGDVGMVPIVRDPVTRKLVGVLTDRDIAVRHVAAHHDWDCSVEEHMTAGDLVTVEPDDFAMHVIRRMKDAQVRRIPVTDVAGRLIGIVALADVARNMGHDAPGTVEELLERLSESMRLPALV